MEAGAELLRKDGIKIRIVSAPSEGLFLAQYLCNGFNLADAGELTYSQYYFDTGRKAFKFKRVKTTNRTEGGSEVIIPIIKPLQRILDEIAASPTHHMHK